jgi:branched-chain amino acid transport system substrate-binding protein
MKLFKDTLFENFEVCKYFFYNLLQIVIIVRRTIFHNFRGNSYCMRNLIKYILLYLISLFLALVLGGCSKPFKKQGEIRIGLIAMLSDENAQNGRDMVDAARLAVNEVNDKGGLRIGRSKQKITLIVEDDKSSPEGAMNAARKLIYQDNVITLVGPQYSSNAIPVARLAESEKVAMICPMSTHPDTTAGKRYVFRIPYIDTFQGYVIARFARNVLKAEKAAVLYDIAGAYNRILAEVFKDSFNESGGFVEAFETYTTDHNQDFGVQLERISEKAPDVLFLPNYSADVLLQAQQAKEKGIRAVLLGGDGWDHALFSKESAFDGSFMTRHWHPDIANEKARAFTASYLESYGRPPGDVAATTYDAFSLLIEAIEKMGQADPEFIQEGIYNLIMRFVRSLGFFQIYKKRRSQISNEKKTF